MTSKEALKILYDPRQPKYIPVITRRNACRVIAQELINLENTNKKIKEELEELKEHKQFLKEPSRCCSKTTYYIKTLEIMIAKNVYIKRLKALTRSYGWTKKALDNYNKTRLVETEQLSQEEFNVLQVSFIAQFKI